MNRKTVLSGYLTLVVCACIIGSGCSKNSPVSNNDNDSSGSIKTGTPVSYNVTSSVSLTVEDKVSGCSFAFPEGGSGTFTVAPVTSSPELGLAATKISIEYDGTEKVELLVPKTSGSEQIVFIYKQFAGVAVDNLDAESSWWGIVPDGERNGSAVFDISAAIEDSKAAKSGKRADNSNIVLAISSVAANSPEAAKIAALRQSVQQCVDWWLENLPPDLASTARGHVEGDLLYDIAFTNEGNAYDHSRHLTGADAIIQLCINDDEEKAANQHTVAHEVGHYMNHVLVGYNRYVELLNRMPAYWWGGIKPHGFADYFEGRKYVIEDYAFLSDALITGTIDNNDITQPITKVIFNSKTPDERDFPSHEGFGVLMLGALLRTNATVNCFWPKSPKAAAPVVGASVADVLGLVAKGARDTNELRQVIQDYLDTRPADKNKLPAMLEPIGWSYSGEGKVVDSNNNPVANAHVLSVSQDGKKEYRTYMSTATLADGSFTLPRIFPGTNILRIFWNEDKDSTDVSFTADWSKLTTEILKIGTLKINTAPAPVTVTLTREGYPQRIEYGDDQIADYTMLATLTASGPGLEIGEDGYIYASIGGTVTAQVTASFTVKAITTSNGSLQYEIGEPELVSDAYDAIVKSGSTELSNNSSGSVLACTFTFRSAGDTAGINTAGKLDYDVYVEEKNGSLSLISNLGDFHYGPKFVFKTK